MIPHWLYDLPLWAMISVVMLACALLTMSGTLLLHRRGWMLHADDATSAAVIHAFVGVVYAIALALTMVEVQGGYHDVEETVLEEVSAAADLFRTCRGLEPPARKQIRSKLRRYVDDVVDKEWPALRSGKYPNMGWHDVDFLAIGIIDFRADTDLEQSLYPQLLSEVDRLLDARRKRLFLGQQGVNGITWGVVFVGALITLGFACFFPVRRLSTHLVITGTMSSLFGLIIALIISMDRPLWGEFSIGPDAFQELRINFQRLEQDENTATELRGWEASVP